MQATCLWWLLPLALASLAVVRRSHSMVSKIRDRKLFYMRERNVCARIEFYTTFWIRTGMWLWRVRVRVRWRRRPAQEQARASCAKESNAKTIENVYLNGCHAYFAMLFFSLLSCAAKPPTPRRCCRCSASWLTGWWVCVAENSFDFIFSGEMKRKYAEGNFQS